MNLVEELRSIHNKSVLNGKTKLKIICNDGMVIHGLYRGFTSALDNEPEIAQIDVFDSEKQWLVGVLETEIESVEVE